MGTSSLATYNRKRDFTHSPEPAGRVGTSGDELSFVVQKHAARSLHYDFRLELDGTLKSWAVPKGPSLDPSVKRMAVEVEDHPLSYGGFEGVIPEGHYGAGSMIVWDRGTWAPVGDARKGYREGRLKFELHGEKLRGGFTLVRMKKRDDERQTAWLLIKERDDEARPAAEFDVVEALPDSVLAKKPPSSRPFDKLKTSRAAPAPGSTAKKRAAVDPGVRRGDKLPLTLSPQLATLVSEVPPGDDWFYEIKFDGYRLLTRIDGDDVRCFTRNGHDWSHRLPQLVTAIRALKIGWGWLDGEIIVAGPDGVPDFQALQNAFDAHSTQGIQYFVFDLPFHDGHDLRDEPLRARRDRLVQLIASKKGGLVQFSAAFDEDPKKLLASARQAGLEGLIGKRADSSYHARRSLDWIKLKVSARQEFVIGGFTDPKGSRSGIGSLLLGTHNEQGELRYAGNVGSGFDQKTLARLREQLDKIETDASPFIDAPERVGTVQRVKPHWVKPRLIAEVSFAQWTRGGHVRQAVFQGLRSDKPPERITKEVATKMNDAKLPKNFRLTHPERVIDAQSGATKGELVAYYAQVAALMLPHLKQRPLALMRAPEGVGGEQFFQKHAEGRALANVDILDRSLYPADDPLLAVSNALGLLSAAQMNVIEFHTWNATTRAMDRPDRMVFDLDPGEGVGFAQVREGTQLLKAFLDELGLKSFLKTSGGKGLHVVVPLTPKFDWDTVKAFSQAVVAHMAEVIPQRFVAKSGPKNRVGKIFIDYLRNGLGATTVAAWSARARPGLGVSVPLAWDELAGLAGAAQWTVQNIGERLPVGNT
ncbi:MAG TPA: DNA ligase D, partial [Rhizobacter sp.]|nr:DNA ligase D [Rhizobacter sp.]